MKSGQYHISLNTTETLNFRQIPQWLTDCAHILLNHGYQAYLVGGAVRDLLLGISPHDWDLTTDALPDTVETLFPKTYPTGKQFGTITVCHQDHAVEITTMRQDMAYSDGRRPDHILFSRDILTDLSRRDFTINAMAYDFRSQRLVDPYNGRRDLYRRRLQTVGEPEKRFAEDGLRMFRFFRFLATMDLRPDAKTLRAVRPEWAQRLSAERIRDELSKLLVGPHVRSALDLLEKSGLLTQVIPELNVRQFRQSTLYPNLWHHLLETVAAIQPRLELRWAALLHDVAKPLVYQRNETGVHYYYHERLGAELSRKILSRLRYSKAFIHTVSHLIEWHMFQLPPHAGDAAVRRLIHNVGAETVPDLLELRRADIVGTGHITRQTWQAWNELYERIMLLRPEALSQGAKKLAIKGQDLIEAFQLAPGPLIGKILSYLTDIVLENPEYNEKNRLLHHARNYLEKTQNFNPPASHSPQDSAGTDRSD